MHTQLCSTGKTVIHLDFGHPEIELANDVQVQNKVISLR